MRSASERREFLDVSTTQRASADLVKQIRKLRWIGMEEARRLQIALSLDRQGGEGGAVADCTIWRKHP
jgi:hypothetical protein